MVRRNQLFPRYLMRAALPALAALFAAGCGDALGPAAQLAVVGGDAGSATVGFLLNDSLTVKVMDGDGRAVPGVAVVWLVQSGGGSVSPANTVSDANGEARAQWRLGVQAGTQTVRAAVGELPPATFTATATAGPPDFLTKAGGDAQTLTVASVIELVVRLRDAHGNGVPGATINWTVTSGGGAVSAPTSTTDAEGLARISFTLGGAVGGNTVVAGMLGLTGVLFGSTGLAGPAALLQKSGGDNQSGGINAPALDSLAVRVTDQYGNGIGGVAVTWAVTPGDGSISPVSTTSRPNGEAKALWVLGPNLGSQSASATAPSLGSSVDFTINAVASVFNLSVGGLYVTQATQTPARSVPLVAGRNGYLRAWVTANQVRTFTPTVRVRWYQGGSLVRTDTIPAPEPQVRTSVAESPLTASWNLPVPGSLLQPGLEIVVDVDPDDQVAEDNETDNVLPAAGRLALDVRAISPLNVTLVPVSQVNGLTGGVNPGNSASYVNMTSKVWPIGNMNVTVHATYATGAPALDANNDAGGWDVILNEMNALRVAEGSADHYYGVVRVGYTSGIAGYGFRPGRAAMGWDYLPSGDEVAAHELGHNFNRLHAPCGNPAGVDPTYPYPGGVIGAYGLDVEAVLLKSPSVVDLMSYCSNPWVSDYNYQAVLSFRTSNPLVVTGNAVQPVLLVWGRMIDGRLVLEPAFPITTRPSLPAEPGPYTLRGRDASGATVFSLSFQASEVGDAPNHRGFAFAIPATTAGVDRVMVLELTDGARTVELRSTAAAAAGAARPEAALREQDALARLEWDGAAFPMALVRDPVTGQIISFARGGAALLPVRGAEVDVVLSDGVRGVSRRVAVTR